MAIRITRVYTRTGDGGRTRLVGGKEVPKDARRIEAYGTLDELNAVLGLARTFNEPEIGTHPASARLDTTLRRLQNEIFDLGSELATPPDGAYDGMYRVGAEDVTRIEHLIDECQKDLEALASFILPGGGRVAAFLHQARTVCRRAEREIVRLGREEAVGEWPIKYVNRLSDLLFVLARWIGHQRGEAEYLWERGLHPPGGSESASKRDEGD